MTDEEKSTIRGIIGLVLFLGGVWILWGVGAAMLVLGGMVILSAIAT